MIQPSVRSLLYIHIPFCKSKCRYCDFYSVAGEEDRIDTYIDSLAREWELRRGNGEYEIISVYIGGGTPSLLSVEQWERLDTSLLGRLPLDNAVEWTVECNPDSLTREKAAYFLSLGITRLTLGVQSMSPRELSICNRPHDAGQVHAVLKYSVLSEFSSIGVDLIAGLPGQSAVSFFRALRSLLDYPVITHLSVYDLTVADDTPFGKHRRLLRLNEKKSDPVFHEELGNVTAEYGFEQYEISNYARKGHRSSHNTGYWNHVPYLGLGCSAHSYIHPYRFANSSDIGEYCSALEKGKLPVENREYITRDTRAREMAFLCFRQTCGLNEEVFHEKTGFEFIEWAGKENLRHFIADKYLTYQKPWWIPTEKGLLNADFIARTLF